MGPDEETEKLMLVDTHAHLQWQSFDTDRDEVISRAKAKGVELIVNVGYDLAACQDAIDIARHHRGVFAAIGIHPHNAGSITDHAMEALRDLARNDAVVAIGEIGLDFYRNLSSRDHQVKAFESQLALAADLSLPAVIHQRDASQPVLDLLRRTLAKRVLVHCWSGSLEAAQAYLQLGCMISIAGPVTFPNAHRLRDVARTIPTRSLMLETDSPWLAPQPYRGTRNEPAYVTSIADAVAKLRKLDVQEIAAATTENARRFFSI